MANFLAYYDTATIMAVKKFYSAGPRKGMFSGLYYKHVTIVIYDRNDIGLYYKPRDDRN